MYAGQQDENLRGVYQQLAADARPDGRGKIYAFLSPRTGAGTSYIARNMAMIAASQTQADQHVLILDIDNCLINGTQIYYNNYDSLRSKQIIIILKISVLLLLYYRYLI